MSDSKSDQESGNEERPSFIFIDLLTARSMRSKTLQHDAIRVEWRIEKFDKRRLSTGMRFTSPTFSSKPFWATDDWQLHLYPNGYDDRSKNNLSLFLYHLSDKCRLQSADVVFYLRDVDGVNHMVTKFTISFLDGPNKYVCGSARFARRPALFSLRKKLLPKGTLTIVCELSNFDPAATVWPQIVSRETQTADTSGTSKSLCDPQITLCKSMVALLKDGSLCDVTLRAEGRDLSAHKLVLAARSIVFRSMFEHPMREKVDNIVEVADIEFVYLERFVAYLYSGKMSKLTTESALGLLAAADKYAVQDLCDICTTYLQEHLDIENSIQVLIVADLHSITELKELALTFICLNFKEVSAKPDWKADLKDRPHLAAELLFRIA